MEVGCNDLGIIDVFRQRGGQRTLRPAEPGWVARRSRARMLQLGGGGLLRVVGILKGRETGTNEREKRVGP